MEFSFQPREHSDGPNVWELFQNFVFLFILNYEKLLHVYVHEAIHGYNTMVLDSLSYQD